MKIIFKKRKTSWLMQLITLVTSGEYGHVEIMFADKMCFSSVPFRGVRLKKITELTEYDIIDFNTTEVEEQEVRRYCQSLIGKKYDYKNVFGFVFHYNVVDTGRYYCSQLCALVLLKMKKVVFNCERRISPSQLFSMVV